MKYLQHVTLNTGHMRRSGRAEVDDAAIDATQDVLAAALHASPAHIAVPQLEEYTLVAHRLGGSLLATLSYGDVPVVTVGVAARDRGGHALWQMLEDLLARVGTARAVACPRAPWCGSVMLTPLADQMWIGDFERCVAWSWLEGKLRA